MPGGVANAGYHLSLQRWACLVGGAEKALFVVFPPLSCEWVFVRIVAAFDSVTDFAVVVWEVVSVG